MPPRRRPARTMVERIRDALERDRSGAPDTLPFEEVEIGFDAIIHALGGAEGVRSRTGSFVEADHTEGSVVVHKAAALIGEWVRPRWMPSVPALDWGVDPNPYLRRMARRVALDGAASPNYRLVSSFEGSDQFFVALVPTDLDLTAAEERYERLLTRRERRARTRG